MTNSFTYKGYKFNVIGEIPRGQEAENCINHINKLGAKKGTFKMGVTKNGWLGTVSTITFSKL
jgi:hypothetical protein